MGKLASASQIMVDFNIYSLSFTSYNRSWSQYSRLPAGNSALLLKTSIVNSSFHGNLGTALVVNNTSNVLVESSSHITSVDVSHSLR